MEKLYYESNINTITKELIISNLTKVGLPKPTFLKTYNLSQKECYDILNDNVIHKCKFCDNNAIFISFKEGYNERCNSTECIKKLRIERKKKTNLKKYGYEHVSQIPKIKEQVQNKIKDTLYKKYGVTNIIQVEHIKNKVYTDKRLKKIKSTLLQKYGVDCSLKINDVYKKGIEKCQTPEINKKRKTTIKEKYGVEHIFQAEPVKEKIKESLLKIGEDGLNSYERYVKCIRENNGYELRSDKRRNDFDEDGLNSFQRAAKKQRKTNECNNRWTKLNKLPDFKRYSREVWKITNKQKLHLLENYTQRGFMKYHLDHIFSVFDGFHNNIPPYIIGNICNLRMIHYKINIRKHTHSDITKDELFNRFFKDTNETSRCI